jgi:hypothetical protein
VILRGLCAGVSASRKIVVMWEISETAWVVHMVFIRICYGSKVASGNARGRVALSLFRNRRSHKHLLCLPVQFGRGRALLIGP